MKYYKKTHVYNNLELIKLAPLQGQTQIPRGSGPWSCCRGQAFKTKAPPNSFEGDH